MARMTDEERLAAIDLISSDPECGDLIVGSGGCRKVRVAGKGKGKSGGYRVITYFANENNPVKLIFVFAKNQASNLDKETLNALARIAKE